MLEADICRHSDNFAHSNSYALKGKSLMIYSKIVEMRPLHSYKAFLEELDDSLKYDSGILTFSLRRDIQ